MITKKTLIEEIFFLMLKPNRTWTMPEVRLEMDELDCRNYRRRHDHERSTAYITVKVFQRKPIVTDIIMTFRFRKYS
jgi:hypothetical protein